MRTTMDELRSFAVQFIGIAFILGTGLAAASIPVATVAWVLSKVFPNFCH